MKLLTAAAIAALAVLAGCGQRSDANATPDAAAAIAAAAGAAAAPPEPDLFAFAAGARFVQKPDDVDYSDLAYSPLNLIDESLDNDWASTASTPAIFVLELPERTAIARIAFDSAHMNFDDKSAKHVKVEVSDTSAATGFSTVLETDLKKATDDQSFTLPAKATGRWVRLTVSSNYGHEYVGLTGFRGYGEQLTHDAKLDGLSGTYEGANGWGVVRLKQEGSRVVGCYTYRSGIISGGVEGRLLKVEMLEHDDDGSVAERQLGLFSFSTDGKAMMGLTRSFDAEPGSLYRAYYSGEKISDDIGDCPNIPGWRKADTAGSQLAEQLEDQGRARLDGVNFDFNSAVIRPESKPLLDQIVRMLADKGDWRVTLEGHTDNIGGAAFNKTLSTQRAAAVKAYLEAGGIAADRLTSEGFGFDKPVASNETQAGRAQNRRVEIVKR